LGKMPPIEYAPAQLALANPALTPRHPRRNSTASVAPKRPLAKPLPL